MKSRAIQSTAACGVAVVLTLVGLVAFWGGEPGPVPEFSAPIPSAEGAERAEGASEGAASAQAPDATPRIMIEIQGAVASPGSYPFPPGARVQDALEKAGGALNQADIQDLNIAAVLLDGSVLTVPYRREHPGQVSPGAAEVNAPTYTRSGWNGGALVATQSSGAVAAATSGGKIDLNTATQAELESLPGVGEKTAEKIIRFRETQRFTQVEDLRYIQGIGDKRLETLRPHVVVN